MDLERDKIVTAASIQMRAEVYSDTGGCLQGTLHSLYLETPYAFSSLLQMIEKMEEIFDTKGFPEAFMTPRMFGTSKSSRNNNKADGNDDVMRDVINLKPQPEPGSSKCTFEINVRFRQNATWQGQILWVEKNLKRNFRSVLEMLKLMDEALNEENETLTPVKWDGEDKE